jgi:hypothetical protein
MAPVSRSMMGSGGKIATNSRTMSLAAIRSTWQARTSA